MATKYAKSPRVKRGKFDVDLDKARVEGNWLKTTELIQQAAKLNNSLGPFSEVLLAEAKLELCDKENPSDDDLEAAEKHLKAAGKITDEAYIMEYKIIYSKLYFLQRKYKDVVDLIEPLNLKTMKIDNPASRFTLLVAEGLAMLGLSLESLYKITGSVKKQSGEHDEKILEYFDLSGDLCILHLQEIDKAGISIYSGSEATVNVGIPKSIETAIQRSPIIHIQNNELNRAIDRLRQLLRYVETVATKGLRQTLARQLAEVLLRGVSASSYQKYQPKKELATSPSFSKLSTKQPALYPPDRFAPEDHIQEAVLMLLISEYIANQEAILNRSPELSDARIRTLHNTTAVYDLLAISLVRKGCYNYLSKTLEHALKFSYKEFHIWYQFALSLISAQKYHRAYLVLQECQRIEENHTEVYFFMASLALEELHRPEEGLEAAEKAIDVAPPVLKARAYLLAGWAYSIMAKECRVSEKKKEFHQAALKNYNLGVETDPDDHLIWYHLALEQAILRQLDSAMSACHRCLSLHPGFGAGLHLLTLLHTASGQTGQAAQVIQAAIYEHPNNISLSLTKAKIDAIVYSPEKALQSYKSLIEIWRDKYAPDYDLSCFLEKLKTTQYNTVQCSELLDHDSGSHRAESLAATRLENALSEIASSLSCSTPKVGISQACYLQMQILLNLGELYIELDKLREASECIEEAANISKLNHQVLYMRGRLYEARGSNIEARRMYESTASINPSHVKTLQRLGSILQVFGEFQLAEKILRDALSYDSTSSKTWQCLGDVLQNLGQNEAASQCFIVAADLEQTEPIEPFYFLPKGINVS